jgi:hypothetical protein
VHLDVTREITALNGDPVWDGPPETKMKVTVGSAVCNALLANYEEERNLSGKDKVERFTLATKLHGADLPVSITVEEAALIKRLVAKLYGPLVTGQVWNLIDADSAASAPKAKAD